jgi:hypothetical protein
MEIWAKICRFLALLLIVLTILVVVAAIVYWGELVEAVSYSISSTASVIVELVLTVAVVIFIIAQLLGVIQF